MEIIIDVDNVIADIGSKHMMELSSSDPIPPKGTVIQSINEANARLVATIGKTFYFSYQDIAEDSLEVDSEINYHIELSPRRAAGKARPLADLIHSYLVNAALTKIMSSVGQADLSAKHDAQAISDAQAIDRLLHSKVPPRI